MLSVLVVLGTGCSGGDDAPIKREPPPLLLVPADGGVGSTAITVPQGVDPSAIHLDDYGGYRPVPQPPLPQRDRRAIDVTLRSSPPGARVAVDGTAVGNTPAFWSGYADGREHEFVFTLAGHAIARYRFVPVSSGVIHARLDPIAEEPRTDAGVMMPPPEVVPQQPPSAVVPPAPPPTIVTPDAALVAPVAPPVEQGSAPLPSGGPVGPQP